MKKLLFIITLMITTQVHSRTYFEHPNQLIVATKKDAKSLVGQVFDKDLAGLIQTKKIGTEGFYLLSGSPALELKKFMEDFKNRDGVEWVAPNRVYLGEYREFAPNDPVYNKQLHHPIIQSEKAWNLTTGHKEIVVAVTDDGYRLDHEDLKDSWYSNPNEIPGNNIDDDNNGYVDDVTGWDFNEGDNSPMSDSRAGSHGTHVAGIVAAGFDNGVGVTGFGPKIKVMPIKFYGKNTWTSAMVLESYTYAADNGAHIITTSYYIDNFVGDQAYEKALEYAYDKGLILFNSAGNGSARQSKRTQFKRLILVASTKTKGSWGSKPDQKSSFSNYGRGVDIAAPGDPIHSTGRSLSYVDMSGTSMAAPNAAGLAALIWSAHPDYTRDQVVAKLYAAVDNVDSLNSRYKHLLGSGRINAFKAVKDEVAPTTIRDSWYDRDNKTFNLHLKGALDPLTFNRRGGIILKRNGYEEVINAQIENEYFLATNVLVLKVEEAGTYELTMKSKSFLDPFGREIDGNLNGNPGGDFTASFSVR
jgi:subtilisin family serine protease